MGASLRDECSAEDSSGFTFDLCNRNQGMEAQGIKLNGFVKTGTTIVGLVYKDGVVLGADTRATEGPIVADKNCEKIHYLAPNIRCCGAGTAADTEFVTRMIESNLELHSLHTGRPCRLVTACRMLKQYLFKYQGHVSAALVLGGVDINGPHLYSIYPHGSTDKLPYVTMGSGSLAAMAIFEDKFRPNMELEEAMDLVKEGIRSGIFNDLGSGSNVDLCVITKEGQKMYRNYELASVPGPRQNKSYLYKKGTTVYVMKISTAVLSSETHADSENPASDPMEL
eukprot:Nk52_evm23s1073 gene=Nk52_evmTU23s1073